MTDEQRKVACWLSHLFEVEAAHVPDGVLVDDLLDLAAECDELAVQDVPVLEHPFIFAKAARAFTLPLDSIN